VARQGAHAQRSSAFFLGEELGKSTILLQDIAELVEG